MSVLKQAIGSPWSPSDMRVNETDFVLSLPQACKALSFSHSPSSHPKNKFSLIEDMISFKFEVTSEVSQVKLPLMFTSSLLVLCERSQFLSSLFLSLSLSLSLSFSLSRTRSFNDAILMKREKEGNE